MIQRAGFDIEEALHSDDGIFAQYLLRPLTSSLLPLSFFHLRPPTTVRLDNDGS